MINRRGKKAKEWEREKRKLLKELKQDSRYIVYGTKVYGPCHDCFRPSRLHPDHVVKRSQGGSHKADNIEWVCDLCHDRRDNMAGSKKNKKVDWQKPHTCQHCKNTTSFLICHICKKISLKKYE